MRQTGEGKWPRPARISEDSANIGGGCSRAPVTGLLLAGQDDYAHLARRSKVVRWPRPRSRRTFFFIRIFSKPAVGRHGNESPAGQGMIHYSGRIGGHDLGGDACQRSSFRHPMKDRRRKIALVEEHAHVGGLGSIPFLSATSTAGGENQANQGKCGKHPIPTAVGIFYHAPMNALLLVVVLLLLFGGGGFYFGGPAYGGGGVGLILLVCLIIFLMGGFRTRN